MLDAKWPYLLLFVFALLTTSKGVAEEAIEPEEHAPTHIVEIFGVLNSTNMTNFACGIVANLLSAVLYGSNFVPVKRTETGDGMFFQWVYCASIWGVSMIGDIILQSPKFHPVAMIGGALWATGNIAAVPVLRAIGLGLGILLWGSTTLLMGWATTRFGLFGVAVQEVSKPIMNYCGAGLCLLSGLIFFFVKSDVQPHPSSEMTPLLIDRGANSGSYEAEMWFTSMGSTKRRIGGCLLAVVSGLLYSSCYIPILYIKSQSKCNDSMFHGASLYDPDYVCALSAGIFLTSTFYFILYCAAMKNKPRVYSRAILPGFLSGFMWTTATYCWFLASNYLSAVITFPIVTAGYGLVAALWGSLVFKEIKGLVNCCIFLLASCFVLTGSILTAISKI
ncbi:transmembrane protein 144b [Genypterus blacodes]|uniref:transmembrane protein 144b n=1 Tax=Genypterus blacodes TaxID=154954 RepID=UPI003F76B199